MTMSTADQIAPTRYPGYWITCRGCGSKTAVMSDRPLNSILLSHDDAKKLAQAVQHLATANEIIAEEDGDIEDVTDAREVAATARDILSRVGVMCPGCFRCSDFAETPDDGRWYLHNPPCPGSCDEACQGKLIEGKPCDGSGMR